MKDKWLVMSEGAKGVLAGVASALCLTGYLVVNRHVYNAYQPSAVEYTLLFALAGGVFGLISLLRNGNHEMYGKIRKDTRHFMMLATLSFIAVGLLVIGQRYTTSINTALVGTMAILSTMFFSFSLLRERPTARQVWWLGGLFVGLYTAIVGFHTVHLNSGDFIVLSSVVFFGLGNVLARKIMKRQGSFVVPNVRLVIAAVFAAVTSIFFMRNFSLMWHILPWAMLAGMFYWLTMKTFAVSVHLVNANHAIVLNNSQIVSTSLAGVFLLGESYTWEKFIGSIIVLTSIYFITWKGRG